MTKLILKINENIFLGESKIHNKGIFALKEILPKKPLLEYTGELITKEEGTRRENESIECSKKDPSKACTYIMEIDDENDLDGDIEKNYGSSVLDCEEILVYYTNNTILFEKNSFLNQKNLQGEFDFII